MNKTEIGADTQMRDAVIDRLYDLSECDEDIMFLTADMGAKALDRWREFRPNQYRDVGIAEQALASIGTGLAKEGKKVFIYAIAPFVTTRIHEFHKLNAGVQKIPYNTIGMGTGFSYSDSGPTHYTTEDIAIMRAIPNMEILSPSDSVMAANMAEYACNSPSPTYLRLERKVMPIITSDEEDLKDGMRVLEHGEDLCIVSTGSIVHEALKARKILKTKGLSVGVAEVYRPKPMNINSLCSMLGRYRQIVSVEEHLLAGGLGSILAEAIADLGAHNRLTRIGIDDKAFYLYGRENIQRELGLDADSVAQRIMSLK